MSPTKTAFLKDKDLTEHLAAVVNADWFTRAVAFARSEMMGDPNISTEAIRGAIRLESILRDLPTEEKEPEMTFPGPGINHELDNPTLPPKSDK